MFNDETPRYTRNQVFQMIAHAVEATGYFDSEKFSEEYLNMYNNGPSPEAIERAEYKFIDNWIS